MIDSCLKLHGQLCPPEMLAFHATLEKFFHKNFADEIRRLSVDSTPEPRAIDAVPTSARLPPSAAMPSPNLANMYVVLSNLTRPFMLIRPQEKSTAHGGSYPRWYGPIRFGFADVPSVPGEWFTRSRGAMDETDPPAASPCTSC